MLTARFVSNVSSGSESRLYDDDEPLTAISAEPIQALKAKKVAQNGNNDLFTLSLKLKHDTFRLNSASGSIEPMLASLNMLQPDPATKMPLDLICVIDTSSSMSGRKMQLLQKTLLYLVDLLQEHDRLSIVKFSCESKRMTPLQRITKANKPNIAFAISSLTVDLGTNITAGMEQALKVIKDRKFRNPVTSVFLLSDGLDSFATQGITDLYSRTLIKDNFTVHSFGYGSDHDPDLMNAIADMRGGNFYFVERLDTVDECFVDAIGGLISTVGENCTLTIEPVSSKVFPNVKIRRGYGKSTTWQVSGDKYRTGIKQLSSEVTKNFVLEVEIPKCLKYLHDHEKEVIIAKAHACIEKPGSQQVMTKQCELKIRLVNEEEDLEEQQADKEVLSHYYRVRAASTMMQARELAEAGRHQKAKKLLQNIQEGLAKSSVKAEAMVKGLLEDVVVAINELEPQIYDSMGMHRMLQQVSSHMFEKSNPFSRNSEELYTNSLQRCMVTITRSSKHNC